MLKLKTDPVSEVVDLLKVRNPLMAGLASDSIFIKSCKVAASGSKNTTMEIIGNGNAGLVGTIAFSYDRLDLTRVFNQFVAVTKKPRVRVFGNPGSTTTVYNLIAQINAALGTTFTVSGSYPDLADQSFTYPAKDGVVDIVISGKYSADGSLPTSIRIKPGTTLTLTMMNNGYKLMDIAVVRSLTPYVRSNRNLNWTLPENNSIDGVNQHPALAARFLDFSDVFIKPASELIIYKTYTGAGVTYTYYYDLTQTAFDMINARLSAAGLAILSSKGVTVAGDQYTPTLEVAKSRLGIATSTLTTNPSVNGSIFNRVLKIPAANMTAKAGVISADYYLHFNQ